MTMTAGTAAPPSSPAGLVAVPRATHGTLDAATSDVLVNCSLVVVILAVTPWRYVWQHYTRAAGEPWTRRNPTP